MLFSVNLCGPLRLCGVEFAEKELTTEARRSHREHRESLLTMDKFRQTSRSSASAKRGSLFHCQGPVALKILSFRNAGSYPLQIPRGTRDHAQIAESLSAAVGLTLTGSMVASFVEELKKKDLIERSGAEKSCCCSNVCASSASSS